ncbi:unnamed protein product, partial [Effrenium voratum]
QKQDSLQNKPKQRKKYQVLLAVKAGLRERTCQTIRNLSQSEVAGRVRTAWRLYDQNLYAAAQPDVQPELPVHDRESWVTHRRETGLTFSDQIPVWLLPPPSKLLTSVRRLQTAAEQRKVRHEQRKNKEPVTVEPQTKTARESPGKPPGWRSVATLPQRRRLADTYPTILVVFGSHARLENIGLNGRWIETEEFVVGEKVIRREAGEKVGGRLMCTWRKLRQERPELLHPDELRVWSQPSAMMDSVTYRWQADLERQEFRQAVDCIDQFAGAWSLKSQRQRTSARGCAPVWQLDADPGSADGCTGAQTPASQRARVGVVDGVPAPFTEEELSVKGEAARALELEAATWSARTPARGFFFDLQADLCATQEEVEEIQSLLLHPRQRSEAWASAVAKTTSQVRKLRKHKSNGRQVRKKRLEQWRAAHQNQTAEKALKSVVPVVKKKKKASLKNKASAKHKPSLKQKASAKEKKKKKSAQKQAAKNAAAAEVVESEKTGPLCGKSVAVVGEAAPAHLSGRTVVVQGERELEVLVEWQGQQAWVQKADLDVEDWTRSLTVRNKMAIRAAEIMGSEPVETVQAGVSLTDGQIRAGILELLLRLTDQVEPPDVHWWEPAAVVAEKPVWLQPVLSSEVSQLVLVPVQSSPPEHWWCRQE